MFKKSPWLLPAALFATVSVSATLFAQFNDPNSGPVSGPPPAPGMDQIDVAPAPPSFTGTPLNPTPTPAATRPPVVKATPTPAPRPIYTPPPATPTPAPTPDASAATKTPTPSGLAPATHMTGPTPVQQIVTPSDTGVTVVGPGQRAQATKRGICENHLSAEDFKALAPSVSWYYNWAATTSDTPPGDNMEFIPMAWGRPGQAGAVAGALGRKPRAILAINEPNLKGQAFITPKETADYYKEVKEIADGHHIPIVGPNMALGSAPGDSIKAKDPESGQMTVYTSMGPFIEAFKSFAAKVHTETGAIGVHSYNGTGDVRSAVGNAFMLTSKPVWVTEFAYWNAGNVQNEMAYMREVVEYMENSSQVAAYAWFKERVDKNPVISLFAAGPGKLTPLGQLYVKLPTHNVHVYYSVPASIEAGNYVRNENMTLKDTTAGSGDFDMASDTKSGTIEYNIFPTQGGTYSVALRVSGARGEMEITQNGQTLGTVKATSKSWHTVKTTMQLAAGAQTIRIYCTGQTLHSLDFKFIGTPEPSPAELVMK